MVSIPQEVQEFFAGKMGWVATSTTDGEPNVTPKGTVQVLDDQHVVFGDLFSLKTRENLERNPKVAVTVIDPGTAKGYQVKGTAELLTSGPLFDKLAAQIKDMLTLSTRPHINKRTLVIQFETSKNLGDNGSYAIWSKSLCHRNIYND